MPIVATDKVIITGKGTLQTDGRYAFDGTVTEVKGRVEQVEQNVYGPTGGVRVHDYKIWLPSWVEVENGDQLTIGTVTTRVAKKFTGADIAGNVDHIQVWVKRFGA